MRAEEQGYGFNLLRIETDGSRDTRLQRILINRGVEGILLLPLDRPQRFTGFLDWKKFSVVSVTEGVLAPDFHRVVPDHFGNALTLCDKLAQRGYLRLGLVMEAAFDLKQNHATAAAVVWWNTVRRSEPVAPLIYEGSQPLNLRAWFERERPHAIITAGVKDSQAVVAELGIKASENVGFAGINLNSPASSPISGIDGRPLNIGAAAIDLLHGLIQRGEQGIPPVAGEIKIKGRWIEVRRQILSVNQETG